jgi:carboxymethylenebutenolidase
MSLLAVEFESLGDRVRGFLALPPGEAKSPAVIVLPSIVGMTAHIQGVALRFAEANYAGLALDPYTREGGGPDPLDKPARSRFFQNLPDPRVMADCDAAATFLRRHPRVDPDRIAVMGFCMGGLYTILYACHAKSLGAAVSYYGRTVYPELNEKKPISPIDAIKNLCCPLLYLGGTEDEFIPRADVMRFQEEAGRLGKPFTLKTYPGARHDFFNDTLPGSYHEAAARASWEDILAFLARHLGTKP